MGFSDIPIRSNGDEIDSGWFNTIRTYLITLLSFIDNNTASPFTIVNNQSSYADLTAISFSKTENTSKTFSYEIYRKTDSSERIETGIFIIHYKPSADTFTYYRQAHNDEDALNSGDASLYVDPSSGVLQYKSDSMSGTNYVGKFSYNMISSFSGGI